MSPRKPSSVFLITEHPSLSTTPPGMPPTTLQAWRLPLTDDTTIEQVVEQHLQAQPLGTTMWVIDDTKATAYKVGLKFDEIDDARLNQEEATQ
jgi:hypothetical protein